MSETKLALTDFERGYWVGLKIGEDQAPLPEERASHDWMSGLLQGMLDKIREEWKWIIVTEDPEAGGRMTDQEYLQELACTLEDVGRFGLDVDSPEGTRWIRMSDTLAIQVAERLRAIASRLKTTVPFEPEAV